MQFFNKYFSEDFYDENLEKIFFYENFGKIYDENFYIFYHKIFDFLLRFLARNG